MCLMYYSAAPRTLSQWPHERVEGNEIKKNESQCVDMWTTYSTLEYVEVITTDLRFCVCVCVLCLSHRYRDE